MRTILLIISSFFTVAAICFVLFNQNEIVVHDQKLTLNLQGPVDQQTALPVINVINAKNEQIKNFACEISAILQSNGNSARLNGLFFYEKDRKFNLRLNSILGPELSMGSNGGQFWLWMGRTLPGLYWADFNDLKKSKLTTPLNPEWVPQCLGLEVIKYDEYTIDQNDNNRWRAIKQTFNAKKEPVTLVTYIDPKKCKITGQGLYNQKGVLETSAEIQEFTNGLPTKITFVYHWDKTSLIIYANSVRANLTIDPIVWQMPDITPKISLVAP